MGSMSRSRYCETSGDKRESGCALSRLTYWVDASFPVGAITGEPSAGVEGSGNVLVPPSDELGVSGGVSIDWRRRGLGIGGERRSMGEACARSSELRRVAEADCCLRSGRDGLARRSFFCERHISIRALTRAETRLSHLERVHAWRASVGGVGGGQECVRLA